MSTEESHQTLAQMIQSYFENLGPDGEWSNETLHDRTIDFKQLIEIGAALACEEFTKQHLRRYINTAPTATRAKHLKGIAGTLLRWGAATGYLTDEQAKMALGLKWEKPKEYVFIPNRRDQAKSHDPLPSGAPRGNVPTHSQVLAWAEKCSKRYRHGSGLIHTAANLGLRSAELRILTADSQVAMRGVGNLVNLLLNLLHHTENQLLEQGSWEDSETVRRFYAGVTDDTHGDVRKLHGLPDRPQSAQLI